MDTEYKMKCRVTNLLGIGEHGPILRVRATSKKYYICKPIHHPQKITRSLHHPNIIRELYQIPFSSHWISVYEDAHGIDLEQVIRHENPAPYAEEMVRQIACGLSYAHKNQLLHRDIKASNIILTPTGTIKIIDFDRGKQRQDHKSKVMGADPFLAPELKENGIYTTKSDIYALGVCWYLLRYSTHPPSRIPSTVPKLLRACLDTKAENRPCAQDIAKNLSSKGLSSWSKKIIPQLMMQRDAYYQDTQRPTSIDLKIPSPSSSFPPQKWLWTACLSVFLFLIFVFQEESKPPVLYSTPAQETSLEHTSPLSQKEVEPPPIQKQKISSSKDKNISPKPSSKKTQSHKNTPSPTQRTSIRIASVPWGAEIWIDEQYRGVTLLQQCPISTGRHTLELRLEGVHQKKDILVSLHTKGFVWNVDAKSITEIQRE